jgi:tetratricopeptide (TPR) repeat protein
MEMESVIAQIESLLSSGQFSDGWEAVDMYIKLGRIDHALYLSSYIVQQDDSQQYLLQAKYPEMVCLGAEFAEEIGDYSKAAYYWEQLLRRQPRMIEAWYGLALAKANVGEISQAQRALEQSLQIDPGYLPSQKLLLSIRNTSSN